MNNRPKKKIFAGYIENFPFGKCLDALITREKNMNDDLKRSYINFLRGLAIFLMMWSHSIQCACGGQFDFFENSMIKFICSFNMPFFMLISGYLFRFSEQKRGMWELIKHKTKQLLYPIVVCSLLNSLLTASIVPALKKWGPLALLTIPRNGLWFLWSVLACSIALAFALKLSQNRLIQNVLIVIGLAFVGVFPHGIMNIYMYPFFVIGYLYARNEEDLKKRWNISGIISTVIFIVMIFFYQKKHFIYTTGLLGGGSILESLSIDFFRWAIGLFGSIAVMWICWLLYGVSRRGKILTSIESLGQDSLAMYALSVAVLSFYLPKIAEKTLGVLPWINWNNYIWLYNLIITPLVTVVYSVFLLVIIRLLKKFNIYRLIFGRQ